MAYYDALKTEWAALSGTTAAKLAAINAMTVAGPKQDVSVSSVVAYLALNAKFANLQSYAASPPTGAQAAAVTAAKEFLAILSTPVSTFQMSIASIYSTISTFLNALAADPASGITAADVTALLAMTATTIPWWKANGYTSPFTQADLDAAGDLI